MSSTLVVGGATRQKDIAIYAPRGTPRVLDFVVISTVQSAITDSQNTVVQVSTASTSEDTRLVELEGRLVGFDGNRDWLLVQGRHHGGIRVLGDISVGDWSNASDLGNLGVASTSSLGGARDIWVSSFSADTAILLDPLESIIHQTTIAAHVSAAVLEVVTVNKVLFREGLQGLVGIEISTFQSTSGGERPARTALTLVLDTSDGTSRHPVNSSGEGGDISRSLVDTVGGELWAGETKLDESSPLLKVHVGELVVAEGVGTVARVVGVDQILIVSEVLQHADEVITRLGLNLVFREPVEELLFVVGTFVDIASEGGSSLHKKRSS